MILLKYVWQAKRTRAFAPTALSIVFVAIGNALAFASPADADNAPSAAALAAPEQRSDDSSASDRLCAERSGPHQVQLQGGKLSGTLRDNSKDGSNGLVPLCHADFPGRSVFWLGLNFENVFNGVTADNARSGYTPKRDPCLIEAHSDASASLRWPAENSSWGLECEMRFTLSGQSCVDLEFTTTPRRNDFAHDRFAPHYAAMMWSSYMKQARDRKIYFYGVNGEKKGWVTLGEDTDVGFDTGAVPYDGAPCLPHEDEADSGNIVEHPAKRFLLPFYYGLVDGDGDVSTVDDTMVYIVMFDQCEPIRFAMWNFTKNSDGEPDTHSPAWDWQFVVRNPEVGKTYSYKARIVYKPFISAERVMREYTRWKARF